MKKVLKFLGIGILVILSIIVISGFYINSTGIPNYENKAPILKVEMDSNSIARGTKMASLICMQCHLGKNTRVLEGGKMEDMEPAMGEVWIPNITKDPKYGIGNYTDGELVFLLRTGIKKNGDYAPPWMPKFSKMSDEDLHDIIAFLRSDHPAVSPSEKENQPSKPSLLTKVLTHVAFKPFPYPEQKIEAPDFSDNVAYGEYLANGVYQCFSCHSADFTTNDDFEPKNSTGFYGGGNHLEDVDGNHIPSSNLTMSMENGIGKWSEADFVKAVKWGSRPDGTPVMFPMTKFTTLEDNEVQAIFAYLKTVPVTD
jgi:mono/diheme cytochrome c family protein